VKPTTPTVDSTEKTSTAKAEQPEVKPAERTEKKKLKIVHVSVVPAKEQVKKPSKREDDDDDDDDGDDVNCDNPATSSAADLEAAVAHVDLESEAGSQLLLRPKKGKALDDDVRTKAVLPSGGVPSTWKKLLVDTNHFHITLHTTIYEYSVTFFPSLEDSVKRKQIIDKKNFEGRILMIGNTLCTTKLIPEEMLEWTVPEKAYGLLRPVDVQLCLVHCFKEGSLLPDRVFSTLFQRSLSDAGFNRIQRNFFDYRKSIRVGERYTVIPGVDVSVTPATTGFSLVCDITNKVARRESVLEMWNSCPPKDSRRRLEFFTKDIVGKIVYTNYNNRSYLVESVDEGMDPSNTFEMGGKLISYAKYVESRYGKRISTNRQPMLLCTRAGSSVYLIPEFCQPTGIDERDRRDFKLMADITSKLFPEPNERQRKIEDSVRIVKEHISKFVDVDIDTHVKVNASVIPVKLPDFRQSLSPKNPVIKQGGKKVKRLLIVYPEDSEYLDDRFFDLIEGSMKDIGIRDLEVTDRTYRGRVTEREERGIIGDKPDFVLFVTPNKNDKILYRTVKMLCTHQLHVPSQVVSEQSLKNPKRRFAVLMGVARQMAVKLGKCPWVMPFAPCTKGTMVFGLDVCHSTSIQKSVVGVVASFDDSFGRYVNDFIVQERGREVVDDLRPFVSRALDKYKSKNGGFPKNILFLRDGVGDGQLRDVNDREVSAIGDVIKEKCPDTKLTFVVVKKRIRTRLFNAGRNPDVGTVVDGVITHPNWYDFFLVSHQTHNGTVSPTHYNVLIDEIKWPKSELQSFIYLLCYQYYNWDGGISVPAPCQYAHKMAFLYGRTLLDTRNTVKSVPRELEDTLLQI